MHCIRSPDQDARPHVGVVQLAFAPPPIPGVFERKFSTVRSTKHPPTSTQLY